MSGPHDRRTGEPSTPFRNFSRPNRSHDLSLSPEHNQDNPRMAPNDSRYMLPFMPSRGVLRSTSNASLQTARDRLADFDRSYEPRARPETSHTTFSSCSVPDLNATALPPMPLRDVPPVPSIPQKHGGPPSAPVAIKPPSPCHSIKMPLPSPAKSTKSGKGSKWGRWKIKVKTAFRIGQKKKGPPVFQVSTPTGFEHKWTYGGRGLRSPLTGLYKFPPSGRPLSGGAGATGLMVSAGRRGSNSGRTPGTSHGPEKDAAGSRVGKEGKYAGPGHQDTEGTAVSDDGDSDWEDEATRIFQT